MSTVIIRCTDPGCDAAVLKPPIHGNRPGDMSIKLMDGWLFDGTRWRCPECVSCDTARAIMTEGIPHTKD